MSNLACVVTNCDRAMDLGNWCEVYNSPAFMFPSSSP